MIRFEGCTDRRSGGELRGSVEWEKTRRGGKGGEGGEKMGGEEMGGEETRRVEWEGVEERGGEGDKKKIGEGRGCHSGG